MRFSFFLFLLQISLTLQAQDNYEIQVYGSPTMTRGMTMFELHSNYTVRGDKNINDGVRPSNHALHETLEITQGITDNFELGFYLFTNYSGAYGWQVVGTHLRPRVAAPEKWHLPVGLSLSAEFGYQRPEYSAETWTLELRPIIDKTTGHLYLSINPTLGFSLKGAGSGQAPGFQPNIKAAWALCPKISAGAEYYGDLGAITHFEKGPYQTHSLFAVVDLFLSPQWEINFGTGWGLSRVSDGLLVKLLVGRRIQWWHTGKPKQ